jgi:hypothetical protein
MYDMFFSRIFWLLFSKSFQKEIAARYHLLYAKKIMKCAKVKYFTILREFQSFGKHNPKLVDILLTALVAAIYKAGNGKISVTQMDAIMTISMESSCIFRKSFKKNDHFCKSWQDKRHAQALESKKENIPLILSVISFTVKLTRNMVLIIMSVPSTNFCNRKVVRN